MPKKSTPSQRVTRYQNTLRALKKNYGVSHKVAQKAYRELKTAIGGSPSRVDVRNHPRISKRSVKAGELVYKREEKEKREKERAKLDSAAILEQAIEELEKGPRFRGAIVSQEFDADQLLVKITIKGKNYTKKITGRIVERKNSTILRWEWSTRRQRT